MARTGLLSVALGFAGAFLDLYSGISILGQEPMASNSGQPTWGGGILALGAAVLITSIVLGSSSSMRMRPTGLLMGVYGVAMLFIGYSMYQGTAPMMQNAALSGMAMLGVGALMVVSGASMSRQVTGTPSMGAPAIGVHSARYAAVLLAAVIIVAGSVVLANPSIIMGPGGSTITSDTTTTSSSGAVQATANSATCSGSGTTEKCTLDLTNRESMAISLSGSGTLVFSGAGGMGVNSVSTSNGCQVLSGSLGPGESAQVACSFAVMELAASGTQVSGTVGLVSGDAVPFLASVS